MIAFVLKNWRAGVAIFILVSLPVLYGTGYWRGYYAGKNSVKIEAVNQAVTVREKQNEIRNHRPDDVQLIDGLRAGSF